MLDCDSDRRPLHVFVSFSSNDEAHLRELHTHLSALTRQRLLKIWTHHALSPGESWESELLSRLRNADIVLLLVSADFMASDYIQNTELAITIDRHSQGEVWVVPILIRPVDLGETWIDGLQTLPAGRRALAEWDTPDHFWAAVASGLREMLPTVRETCARRSQRLEPIGVPASIQQQRLKWRTLVERILILEKAGLKEGELQPLRQKAAELKRQAREGHPPLAAADILDDRYQLLEQIGQGGFARVWKGVDLRSNEVVALKVLKGDFAQDITHRERFELGTRAMMKLSHPGIVALHGEGYSEDFGYVTGEGAARRRYIYCAMEFVPGGDLRKFLEKDTKRPSADRMLRLILELASALEYAHGRGCIHRDVKPGNVLLTADGHPKLTDFDMAKLGESTHGTRTGALGTFVYAAPEMHEPGLRADARADVYSLAMTAISGLYGGDGFYRQMMGNRELFIASLPIPNQVRAVLARALAWRPEDRYPTMRAFREALEQTLRESPPNVESQGKMRTPSPSTQSQRSTQIIHDKDGSVLVYVPGGRYKMGSDELDSERPAHSVTLNPFWIGRYPVSNAQYARFLQANPGIQPPPSWGYKGFDLSEQPVVGVSWYDAQAYCGWAGLQLPTEAQWEAAARGQDGRRYPWGDTEPSPALACFQKGMLHPAVVGFHEHGAGPNNTLDQAGNVWEWCEDYWHNSYDGRPTDGSVWLARPEVPTRSVGLLEPYEVRIVRGGAWYCHAFYLVSSRRHCNIAKKRFDYLGFRVVRPADG